MSNIICNKNFNNAGKNEDSGLYITYSTNIETT